MRPASAVEGAEEWRTVAPYGVAFADARIIVPRVDDAGLEVMMGQVVEAARQLATAEVDLIVQCGAPGTFLKGYGYDDKVCGDITQATGIPAITMMVSQMQALKALGAKKIAVATVYTDAVNAKMKTYMEKWGFKVTAMKGLQVVQPSDVTSHDDDSSYRLARSVFRMAPESDAILVSCGAYRTFKMLPYLEMDMGVPVVSSNQATLWHALRTCGLKDVIPNLGKLWAVA
jgi:maleate isomerase